MLLAKIKGNKVYFRKFATFLGRGGGSIYPLDPLEGVSRGSLAQKFSKRGGSAQILSVMGVLTL